MLARWAAAGQPVSDYWRSTPREVKAVLDGVEASERRKVEDAARIAWRTADLIRTGFHKPDKFPSFDKAFGFKARPQRQQKPEEIMDALKLWMAGMQANAKRGR